jgi:hypothetical protein
MPLTVKQAAVLHWLGERRGEWVVVETTRPSRFGYWLAFRSDVDGMRLRIGHSTLRVLLKCGAVRRRQWGDSVGYSVTRFGLVALDIFERRREKWRKRMVSA